jgi:formylglycine-generating enzyme required for sulfatase activity
MRAAALRLTVKVPVIAFFVEPYRLAVLLVSNRECIEFMVDGGYQNPLLWLAEGWTEMYLQGWTMPLYWERRDDTYWTMTLRGSQPVDLDAPVTHVSYFEADALATWSGRRLPTEAEWEHAAQDRSPDGNFADSGRLRPKRTTSGGDGMHQLFGDVEWTRSAFQPYPRSSRPPVRWANIMASSCQGSLCYAAVPV